MTATTRRTMLPNSLLVLLLCAAPAFAQPAAEDFETPVAPGSARPGWTLAFGLGGAALDLDDSVVDRLTPLGIELSERGGGAEFSVGYSFSDQFQIEAVLRGHELSTGDPEVDAGYGEFLIQVSAPLRPRERVTPYLSGAAGGAGIVLHSDEIGDRVLEAGLLSFGGGLEVRVSARFALDLHYQVGVLHFQRDHIESADLSRSTDFEGEGISHTWGLRTIFSF